MAETMRPKPKMSPEASEMSSCLTVSKLHDVPSDVHSRSRCDEEEAGRGKRAGRKPRYSADAMAAGTTTPKPSPQSHKKAGSDNDGDWGRRREVRQHAARSPAAEVPSEKDDQDHSAPSPNAAHGRKHAPAGPPHPTLAPIRTTQEG